VECSSRKVFRLGGRLYRVKIVLKAGAGGGTAWGGRGKKVWWGRHRKYIADRRFGEAHRFNRKNFHGGSSEPGEANRKVQLEMFSYIRGFSCQDRVTIVITRGGRNEETGDMKNKK